MKKGLLLLTLVLLASCSDDSSSGTATTSAKFIDSAVEGLEYSSGTLSGTTASGGVFTCTSGDIVTFKINSQTLGTATCASTITPYTIQTKDSLTDDALNNMVFLLQNLDADGDPTNGISIEAAKKAKVTAAISLTDSAAIDTLAANAAAAGTAQTKITKANALNHLKAFGLNIGTYSGNYTIDHNPQSNCSILPLALVFAGDAFSVKLDGTSFSSNHSRGTPTLSTTSTTLKYGGAAITTNSTNDSTAAVLGSGTPGYFKNPAETTSSTCTGKSQDYVQHAVRITNLAITDGAITGQFGYTVQCENGSTIYDYDECLGSFSFTKQ